MMETESEKGMLAYQRKRLKRAKNRKVRMESVADDWNMRIAVQNSRKGKQ